MTQKLIRYFDLSHNDVLWTWDASVGVSYYTNKYTGKNILPSNICLDDVPNIDDREVFPVWPDTTHLWLPEGF